RKEAPTRLGDPSPRLVCARFLSTDPPPWKGCFRLGEPDSFSRGRREVVCTRVRLAGSGAVRQSQAGEERERRRGAGGLGPGRPARRAPRRLSLGVHLYIPFRARNTFPKSASHETFSKKL